jgi:hypothetical protein
MAATTSVIGHRLSDGRRTKFIKTISPAMSHRLSTYSVPNLSTGSHINEQPEDPPARRTPINFAQIPTIAISSPIA